MNINGFIQHFLEFPIINQPPESQDFFFLTSFVYDFSLILFGWGAFPRDGRGGPDLFACILGNLGAGSDARWLQVF